MSLDHWWALPLSERLDLEPKINHIVWVTYRDDPAGLQAFVAHAVEINEPTSVAIAEVIVDMFEDDGGRLAVDAHVDVNSLRALLSEKMR